jgi:ATP-dependent Clp protease ATP-binding subunit ClpA
MEKNDDIILFYDEIHTIVGALVEWFFDASICLNPL